MEKERKWKENRQRELDPQNTTIKTKKNKKNKIKKCTMNHPKQQQTKKKKKGRKTPIKQTNPVALCC